MYHSFFIHLSVHGHLGCFLVLAIVNSAAMKIWAMCLFELWFLQGIFPVYDSLEWWIGLGGWGESQDGGGMHIPIADSY